MASSRQIKYVHSKDSFCYICGEFRTPATMRAISENVRRFYTAYFGRHINERPWTPRVVCTSCVAALSNWTTKKRTHMPFGVPMLWGEPYNHAEECYFCVTEIRGINKYNRQLSNYPTLSTARRPLPHSSEVPVPVYKEPEADPAEVDGLLLAISGDTTPESDENSSQPEPIPARFNQEKLNDLIRDLRFPKISAELLASRLKHKNMLETGAWSKYESKVLRSY